MKISRLDDFTGGWFIGNFQPSILETSDFEVSVKAFPSGAREPLHHQRVATEISVVVAGQCRIGEAFLEAGDIVEIPPFEAADFEALTDVVLVAVKTPSLPSDKILGPRTEGVPSED